MSVEAAPAQSQWYIPDPQRQELTFGQQMSIQWNSMKDHVVNALGLRHFPSSLRHGIENVAEQNNISRWDVVRMLREKRNPDFVAEVRGQYQDKTLYFGCIHGGSPEFVSQLNNTASSPKENLPDMIVFGGDLAGAIEQRTIRQKQYFYDYLMNRAGPLLFANADISRDDLLNATGNRPPNNSPTVRDGALKLLQFALEEMAEYDLSGQDREGAMKRLMLQQMEQYDAEEVKSSLVARDMDELLDQYIRWIKTTNLNSGTWVGTLPTDIRQRYMDQYQEAAEALAQPLLKLKKRGVDILWVEGNEDSGISLQAAFGDIERIFDTQKYFEEKGIECQKAISGIEGKASYHVLLPFFEIKKQREIPSEILKEIEDARKRKKAIIVVAHMHFDHSRHFPNEPNPEVKMMTQHLSDLLKVIKPDELIYPHQHAEMPSVPDINAKYVVDQTVVTYLPLLKTGKLHLPIHDRKGRNIVIFGGKRQPVRRTT